MGIMSALASTGGLGEGATAGVGASQARWSPPLKDWRGIGRLGFTCGMASPLDSKGCGRGMLSLVCKQQMAPPAPILAVEPDRLLLEFSAVLVRLIGLEEQPAVESQA